MFERASTGRAASDPTDEDLRGQYLYRTVAIDGGEETLVQDFALGGVARSTLSAEKRPVCFEVTARHIPTGEETISFEGCVDLGDAPQTPEKDATEEHLKYGLGICVDPGEFKAEWCGIFAEPLRTGSCDGYRTKPCAAALETFDPPKDESDAQGLDGKSSKPDTEGCAINTPSKSSSLPHSLLLAGAGALLFGRRLRARQS